MSAPRFNPRDDPQEASRQLSLSGFGKQISALGFGFISTMVLTKIGDHMRDGGLSSKMAYSGFNQAEVVRAFSKIADDEKDESLIYILTWFFIRGTSVTKFSKTADSETGAKMEKIKQLYSLVQPSANLTNSQLTVGRIASAFSPQMAVVARAFWNSKSVFTAHACDQLPWWSAVPGVLALLPKVFVGQAAPFVKTYMGRLSAQIANAMAKTPEAVNAAINRSNKTNEGIVSSLVSSSYFPRRRFVKFLSALGVLELDGGSYVLVIKEEPDEITNEVLQELQNHLVDIVNEVDPSILRADKDDGKPDGGSGGEQKREGRGEKPHKKKDEEPEGKEDSDDELGPGLGGGKAPDAVDDDFSDIEDFDLETLAENTDARKHKFTGTTVVNEQEVEDVILAAHFRMHNKEKAKEIMNDALLDAGLNAAIQDQIFRAPANKKVGLALFYYRCGLTGKAPKKMSKGERSAKRALDEPPQ